MKVVYVTMQFPVPSETFLSLDVETLRSLGIDVSVLGLRFDHKDKEDLLRHRGHGDISCRNFNLATIRDAFLLVFLHFPKVISLIFWVLHNCHRSPVHLVKSFLLLPSVCGQYYRLSKEKPDVVHLFWGHYPAMVGYLAKRYLKGVVVTQFLGAHDLMEEYPGSVSFSHSADCIFTHTRSNLEHLKNIGIDVNKVVVVYRGTTVSNGNFDTTDLNTDRGIKFLTASRLIRDKGVDDVIQIFHEILSDYPQSQLVIAGDGPFGDELKSIVSDLKLSDRVKFLGHVHHDSLLLLMEESDIFILMSKYPSERLPNVIKEAMLRKCLVVTTSTKGIDELVENGISGIVVDQGDTENAVTEIRYLVQNKFVLKGISEKGASTIIEKFDVNRNMQKYIDVWSKCLNRNAR